MTQQSYKGNANLTGRTTSGSWPSNVSPGVAGTFTLDDATGYPTGEHTVAIDYGEATVEHVRVTRSGTTFTIVARGVDDTTAQSHAANVLVRHVWDAASAQRHEDHLYDTTDAHPASAITFTPAGLIVATNVQAALVELDNEKAVIGHTHTIPTTATFRTAHTWAISGEIKVAVGETDYINPMWIPEVSGQVTKLYSMRADLHGGIPTSFVGFKLQGDGADLTGLSNTVLYRTPTTTHPASIDVVDYEKLAPVVTTVGDTPTNFSVTVVLEHTVTLA